MEGEISRAKALLESPREKREDAVLVDAVRDSVGALAVLEVVCEAEEASEDELELIEEG